MANGTKVLRTHRGPFILDHTLVIAELNVKQQTSTRQTEMVRIIKDISTEQWIKAFEEEDLQLSDDFDVMVTSLNSTLNTILNKLAPEKKVCKSFRPKHPWYTADLRQHKWMVCKLEKKWLKYKLDSCWMAYKKAKNAYFAKLNINKKATLRAKIAECANDSKELHNLINNLTTYPLPPANSDEELANMFAKFFKNKILTIRQCFQDIPQYQSQPASVPKLWRFSPMTERQVELIVKNMKTKSCESDPIPTQILKQLLPTILPYIMRVVNLSLSEGCFHNDWKTAIVRPLPKKLGLQLINSNYHPVSNLMFISKLIEKCMWHQLNKHCINYKHQLDYQSAHRQNYSCETSLKTKQ